MKSVHQASKQSDVIRERTLAAVRQSASSGQNARQTASPRLAEYWPEPGFAG